MARLNDKFGIYVTQIKNSIEDRKCAAADRVVLQGKLNALTQAGVVLRSVLLTDILEPAKKLSLISQKESNDINTTVNALKRTREKYKRWQEMFAENPKEIFNLPTLKRILNQMDTENNTYQGIKLYFAREKHYIQDYTVSIIVNIIGCIDRRFGKLDERSDNVTDEAKEGDTILVHICRVLNTKVLPAQVNMDSLSMQVGSLKYLYEHFKKMSLFEGSDLVQIIDGYYEILSYVTTYFPVHSTDPTELWKNVFQVRNHDDNKEDWSLTLLTIEICLCAPNSNAALERFFSLLKCVKSTLRCRLTSDILNALMRVKISGPSLEEFHAAFGKKCVDHWYSSKNGRLNQKKQDVSQFASSEGSGKSDTEDDDMED